jgi:hypothetical protein
MTFGLTITWFFSILAVTTTLGSSANVIPAIPFFYIIGVVCDITSGEMFK